MLLTWHDPGLAELTVLAVARVVQAMRAGNVESVKKCACRTCARLSDAASTSVPAVSTASSFFVSHADPCEKSSEVPGVPLPCILGRWLTRLRWWLAGRGRGLAQSVQVGTSKAAPRRICPSSIKRPRSSHVSTRCSRGGLVSRAERVGFAKTYAVGTEWANIQTF